MTLYCTGLGIAQLSRAGIFALKFFTVWTWWLLTIYFALGALGAFRAQRTRYLDHLVLVLFQINVQMVLTVVLMTWGVLYPMLKALPSWGRTRQMLISFTSYNQHGANLAFLIVDMLLSDIPPLWHLGAYSGFLHSSFGIWALAHQLRHGRPLYPFLDVNHPQLVLRYIGLYAGWWFFLWMSIRLQMGIANAKRAWRGMLELRRPARTRSSRPVAEDRKSE